MDTWSNRLHAMSGQGRGESRSRVEICPHGRLSVADPGQAVCARRRHRLLRRVQIFLAGHEGDHRVGVGCGSVAHHARQHQAGWRILTTATDCPRLICSLPVRSTLSACNYDRDGRNAPRRERLGHRIAGRPAMRQPRGRLRCGRLRSGPVKWMRGPAAHMASG